jgi:hypothetical protein
MCLEEIRPKENGFGEQLLGIVYIDVWETSLPS